MPRRKPKIAGGRGMGLRSGYVLESIHSLDGLGKGRGLESTNGRSSVSTNIRDFSRQADEYPEHHGIILANQNQWTLSALISALDRLLTETEAEDWIGQLRWLNDWRL